MRFLLIALFAFGAFATAATGAADDPKSEVPQVLEGLPAAFLCSFSSYIEDPRDQKPAQVGPGEPKACDPDLFTAIAEAFQNANDAYGVTPFYNPDVQCDSGACKEEETCDGYSWYTVKYEPMVVSFNPLTNEWCVSLEAASYTGRGAGCTDCGDYLF